MICGSEFLPSIYDSAQVDFYSLVLITASDLEKCQSDVREQKQYRDELEAKLMAGEDLVQQQVG